MFADSRVASRHDVVLQPARMKTAVTSSNARRQLGQACFVLEHVRNNTRYSDVIVQGRVRCLLSISLLKSAFTTIAHAASFYLTAKFSLLQRNYCE